MSVFRRMADEARDMEKSAPSKKHAASDRERADRYDRLADRHEGKRR